jgi:hypothetical protein
MGLELFQEATNTMICSIMQPTYLPWLGYFSMINQSEKFIFLDSVQFVRRSWGCRNRIKSNSGELFLTVPIEKGKSRKDVLYLNAKISGDDWKKKHLSSIWHAYKKSKYFDELYPFVEKIITQESECLSDYNISIITKIMAILNIDTPIFRASEIENTSGTKEELLVSICKELSCKKYLSAMGSSVYIENGTVPGGAFSESGLSVYYQNYLPVEYSQLFGEFTPYLSIIDVLFNCGIENTREILTRGELEYVKPENIYTNYGKKSE